MAITGQLPASQPTLLQPLRESIRKAISKAQARQQEAGHGELRWVVLNLSPVTGACSVLEGRGWAAFEWTAAYAGHVPVHVTLPRP